MTSESETEPVKTGGPQDRLLPWDRVRDVTGLSRSTAWRLQQVGDFPEPVRISLNRVGWWESELTAWKATRTVRGLPHPRPLARPREPKLIQTRDRLDPGRRRRPWSRRRRRSHRSLPRRRPGADGARGRLRRIRSISGSRPAGLSDLIWTRQGCAWIGGRRSFQTGFPPPPTSGETLAAGVTVDQVERAQ